MGAALAGAESGAPRDTGGRSALLVGNVGKLGAELLNVLLESPRYARIAVAVDKPLRVMVPKLQTVAPPAALAGWDAAAALGWVPDDLFLCIEPEWMGYWKSDRPYCALDAPTAVALARSLRAAGTRRAAVVTPIEALQQLGAVPMIRDADEVEIVNAGFERLLVLRPTAEERAARGSGFFGVLGAGVVRVLASYLIPKGLQPIRVRRAAQIAVESLAHLENGVHVIGAAHLRELAGDPMEGKRPF